MSFAARPEAGRPLLPRLRQIANSVFTKFLSVNQNCLVDPSGKSVATLRAARAAMRDVCAIVTERWRGLRWTLWRQAGLIPPDENAAAYGEVVWSWRRDPGVKLAASVPLTTVAKQAAHRGEHEISRSNHCAGKAGMSWLHL